MDARTELRDKPAGSVRITSGDHVLRTILLPKLLPVIHRYPDIHIEFDVSYGLRISWLIASMPACNWEKA